MRWKGHCDMNMEEREEHKRAGRELYEKGASPAERAKGLFMIIEAHFARNEDAPSLEVYASHWLWAQKGRHDKKVLDLLITRYPLPKRPRIQSGYSDWDSYGKSNYPPDVRR
jgi:hypothetical protein